ncbi:MAG: hypothetical protein P4L50_14385 [Anaerolineaceae bacterium]|nr:hypothetical protein [Anaerolineaceae bacterium]
MTFDIKDGITLSIAALGAVLGIINTLHSLDQKRVKLKVIPKVTQKATGQMIYTATTIKNGFPALAAVDGCIEVVNLSAFPVTIHEIGFTVKGQPEKKFRLAIPQPAMTDGKGFPRRLEQRESFTGYFRLEEIKTRVRRAYARTECGVTVYGSSPIVKEVLQKLYEQV